MEHGHNGPNWKWLAGGTLLILGVILSAWATWVTTMMLERSTILQDWAVWRGTVNVQLQTIQNELQDIKGYLRRQGWNPDGEPPPKSQPSAGPGHVTTAVGLPWCHGAELGHWIPRITDGKIGLIISATNSTEVDGFICRLRHDALIMAVQMLVRRHDEP